ncbi:hypothetical protein ACVXG8_26745 [Escherichia coli]
MAGATVSGVSHSGDRIELNGKGSAARPTLTVSNLHGMVTGMAESTLQSLVGGDGGPA